MCVLDHVVKLLESSDLVFSKSLQLIYRYIWLWCIDFSAVQLNFSYVYSITQNGKGKYVSWILFTT